MRRVSATEARVHFGELMRHAVTDQEPILVERDGKAYVVIISVAQYERLKAGQEMQTNWRDRVELARQGAAKDLQGRSLPPAEEIIREMREERDGELLDLH